MMLSSGPGIRRCPPVFLMPSPADTRRRCGTSMARRLPLRGPFWLLMLVVQQPWPGPS
jgi:hypothetical protein